MKNEYNWKIKKLTKYFVILAHRERNKALSHSPPFPFHGHGCNYQINKENDCISNLSNTKCQLVNLGKITYSFNSSDSCPLNCLSTSLKLGVYETILLQSSEDSVYTPSTRPFIYKIQTTIHK